MVRNLFALYLVLVPQLIFGHGRDKHKKEDASEATHKNLEIYQKINANYLKNVKPIFQEKCLDCHGIGNEKPWYYVLPGAKQLMDSDIDEAKEHMDMSKGFPFGGHGEPEEDLEELKKVVDDSSMPPWQYKIMHWSSSLTTSEKKLVTEWVENSLKILKSQSSSQ